MSPYALEASLGPSTDQVAIQLEREQDRVMPTASADTVGPTPVLDCDWSGNGTVLVADDDEAVGAVAAAMLEHLGFSVVRVNDGREALTAYSQHRGDFAFLLLDLTMPMGGEDVLDEFERMGSATPIVLFSGYSVDELSERLSGKGVATFLQKPFELGDLLAAAHDAVVTSSRRERAR